MRPQLTTTVLVPIVKVATGSAWSGGRSHPVAHPHSFILLRAERALNSDYSCKMWSSKTQCLTSAMTEDYNNTKLCRTRLIKITCEKHILIWPCTVRVEL